MGKRFYLSYGQMDYLQARDMARECNRPLILPTIMSHNLLSFHNGSQIFPPQWYTVLEERELAEMSFQATVEGLSDTSEIAEVFWIDNYGEVHLVATRWEGQRSQLAKEGREKLGW